MMKWWDKYKARKWYRKNKAILNRNKKLKAAKSIRDKKYYANNREKILGKCKEYNKQNAERISKKKKQYYLNNRKKILGQMKERRNREGYKEKRIEYDLRNREKISSQNKTRCKRWARKQIDNITDQYCIQQIMISPLNRLTREQVKNSPKLIAAKRKSIKEKRKRRNIVNYKAPPYEFNTYYRD